QKASKFGFSPTDRNHPMDNFWVKHSLVSSIRRPKSFKFCLFPMDRNHPKDNFWGKTSVGFIYLLDENK
ncbi:MAG: hypothetical protein ONB16_13800, partial [candidate division KSB1 bacterium]|nr:hypothetical protein [candidate division KSB1 bacterium]